MTDKQLWGGETTKAVANFPISGETVPVSVVRWLARVKGAAAAVNGELGLLSKVSAKRSRRPPLRSPRASTTPSFRSTSSRRARAPRRT